MTTQTDSKHKKTATKLNQETTVASEKSKLKPKTATILARIKQRASLKSEEPLAKAQKELRASQTKVKHERQARRQAEKALTEVQEALAAARLEVEQEHQAQVKRVSFVIRLTVGEHGQLGRTEIEHISSSRKQNFLSLDGERLVVFMKACISPVIISENTIPTGPPQEKLTIQTPGPLRPKCSLIVSDVRVFRLEDPDINTLVLTPEVPFVVQARFQLQGPEAHFLTTQETSFEIRAYSNEVISGKSKLLTTYSTKLMQDVLEYTAPAEVPGLPPGLYRLFTIVTFLCTPIKLAGFYDKTTFEVS